MISPGLEKSKGMSNLFYTRNWTDSKKHILWSQHGAMFEPEMCDFVYDSQHGRNMFHWICGSSRATVYHFNQLFFGDLNFGALPKHNFVTYQWWGIYDIPRIANQRVENHKWTTNYWNHPISKKSPHENRLSTLKDARNGPKHLLFCYMFPPQKIVQAQPKPLPFNVPQPKRRPSSTVSLGKRSDRDCLHPIPPGPWSRSPWREASRPSRRRWVVWRTWIAWPKCILIGSGD